jgi:DNA repair protein RadA/Sms
MNENLRTLYVSGEESAKQIKMRAERLGGVHGNCLVLAETLLENILKEAGEVAPQLLIIDSIQTIYSQNIESSAGSVSQVRECAAALLRFAKETGTPVVLIGHITKDGSIAGPKVLEHIVDVVLQFEGDNRHAYRILRSIKNRFGSTAELAVYQMCSNGLQEILNPSEMFIPMHGEDLSGIAVAAMLDGSRPFLIEVQSLVSTAAYGTPQRSATGFDVRRMNMLLAVLEKRVGFKLSQKDVFLNIAGGLKISDPACDLAIIAAILSSNFDSSLPANIAFAGEIGLSGEIRPVSQIEKRISEAAKLGIEKIFISSFNKPQGKTHKGLQVVPISTVADLVKQIF